MIPAETMGRRPFHYVGKTMCVHTGDRVPVEKCGTMCAECLTDGVVLTRLPGGVLCDTCLAIRVARRYGWERAEVGPEHGS